jgi:hypothetical protein
LYASNNKNFENRFYCFFYEDSENNLFEVDFYVGPISGRPNWAKNGTTLERTTARESLSKGSWHKANLKELKEWAEFYNEGSLDFSKWNKNACKVSIQ